MEKQYEASCDLSECVQETNTYKRALATGIVTCMDTGDGMVLAFEGNPLTPANLSLEIAHARGFSPNRPIRMGLHSGPAMRVVDINGRPNYKGVGINVAQRVMDCAIGGQITMTEHYASILRSYDGWAERIASRGTHTVKHRLRLRICELLHPFAPKQPMKAVLSRDLPAVPALVRRLGIAVVLGASFLNFWFLAPWPNAAKDSGQNSALPDISKPFKPPPPDPATQARLDRENAEAAKPFLGLPSGPSDIDPGLVEHS